MKAYMITYMRSEERVKNFHDCKKLCSGDLQLFEAVDGLRDYEKLCSFDKENNFHTEAYRRKWQHMPGKLGCNLSYSTILSKIIQDPAEEWFLILEDDAGVCENFFEEAQEICELAKDIETHFVRLYVGSGYGFWPEDTGYWNFSPSKQFSEDFLIKSNFYKMMPQWYTTAQLISKEGAKRLLSVCPWNDNIDLLLNRFSHLLFATSYPTKNFYCKGSDGINDSSSEMGSVIYENIK